MPVIQPSLSLSPMFSRRVLETLGGSSVGGAASASCNLRIAPSSI